MGLVTCPDCMNSVSETAQSCPKCGRPFTQPEMQVLKARRQALEKEAQKTGALIGALITLTLIGGCALFARPILDGLNQLSRLTAFRWLAG